MTARDPADPSAPDPADPAAPDPADPAAPDPADPAASAAVNPTDTRFRRTLVRVMGVQVVTLVLLGLLQRWFSH